jgi:allantoinase
VPYFDMVDGRPFLITPYTLTANDYLFWQRAVLTAREFADYCIDEFETLFEESGHLTRLMSLGLHPRIIGRPGRIGALRRFLEHVMTRPDVWLASRSQIAHHWSSASDVAGQWNFQPAG